MVKPVNNKNSEVPGLNPEFNLDGLEVQEIKSSWGSRIVVVKNSLDKTEEMTIDAFLKTMENKIKQAENKSECGNLKKIIKDFQTKEKNSRYLIIEFLGPKGYTNRDSEIGEIEAALLCKENTLPLTPKEVSDLMDQKIDEISNQIEIWEGLTTKDPSKYNLSELRTIKNKKANNSEYEVETQGKKWLEELKKGLWELVDDKSTFLSEGHDPDKEFKKKYRY